MQRRLSFALLLLVCSTVAGAANVFASADLTQLAQAQPAPAPPSLTQPAAPGPAAPDPAATAADTQAPVEEPIGNVATVTGSASVVRNNETTPLKVKDDIYLNDVVQTAANSALGITFNDATTFNLKANTQIAIDTYVYEDGGKNNAGVFDVAKGTAAFVAAAVAKTGDMKITTPTAVLGIRGTTGLVEVPVGAAANNPRNVAIKLYPDADGKVGRIEVNDRAGARLGFLTQGASGFTIRPGAGGARFAAVPLTISPQQMQRDQGFVRQVHSTQNLGRQVVLQQREFRRANPGLVPSNAPHRGPQQNGLPGQNRRGQQPGLQNRPGQQQPGQQNRPGQQLQNRPGQPQRPQQPGSPNRQGQQLQRPGAPAQPGAPQQTGLPPRPGRPQQPAAVGRPGAPAPSGAPVQPGSATQPGAPQRLQQPGGPQPVQQPGFRQGLRPGGLPGVLRPGLPIRPGLRLPPKGGKPRPKEVR
jgi:hypothetical protein